MYYEKYEKLIKLKNLKNADVSRASGVSNMTLSDWKNGKSTPKEDKLKKIAGALDVTFEYLTDIKEYIECSNCGFAYDPLSEESIKEHEQFHNKFLKIKDDYPFFIDYDMAYIKRNQSIMDFRNPENSTKIKLRSFQTYLEADFSMRIANNGYNIDDLDFDKYCKLEVASLRPDELISQKIIDKLYEEYEVDKDLVNENKILLERAINNQQLMRLLAYAEKLAPETLKNLEIQVKALADNKK